MPSTETRNLDKYISDFRDEPEIADEDKEAVMELVNALAAEGAGPSRQRKYIYALKSVLNRFAPEDFHLLEASEKELRTVMAELYRSDLSDHTIKDISVCLKKFYRVHNGGECPDKAEFIQTTQDKPTTVTREDLFTESEINKLMAGFKNLRDKAFAMTLYESAARPGELLHCSIADVEFNQKGDFIHLEGAKGTPDRTNQLIEAGQYLRQWIRYHPAGGDVHEPKDSSAPLWIKTEQTSCTNCGTTRRSHKEDGCEEYEPMEYERFNYTAFYRNFKRACDRAEIGDHRPYDFRHTRITEVSKFMSHEQLCKFAGWVPGSDRAKVYVHLTNDDVNEAIREEYGLSASSQDQEVECRFCGMINPPDRSDCQRCRRPLSLEKKSQKDSLQQAVDLVNEVEDGGIEQAEKLQTLIENANRIEELLG